METQTDKFVQHALILPVIGGDFQTLLYLYACLHGDLLTSYLVCYLKIRVHSRIKMSKALVMG